MDERRQRRRQRYSDLYDNRGEEYMEMIYNRILAKIEHHRKGMKDNNTRKYHLREFRFYYYCFEDLLRSGIYILDPDHYRVLGYLKKIFDTSFEQRFIKKNIRK